MDFDEAIKKIWVNCGPDAIKEAIKSYYKK